MSTTIRKFKVQDKKTGEIYPVGTEEGGKSALILYYYGPKSEDFEGKEWEMIRVGVDGDETSILDSDTGSLILSTGGRDRPFIFSL